MKLAFSPVPDESRGIVRAALEATRLPTDDLDEPSRRFFQLSDDHGPIGFVGTEGDGEDRLHRSLVVLPGRKRQGQGGLLVARFETLARREGTKRLHLLTTTVTDFFRSRGYRAADRAHAPAVIAAITQFAALCPGSATYLVKELS